MTSRVRGLIVSVCLAVFAITIPAFAQDDLKTLKLVARDIEKLRASFPQLEEFSLIKNLLAGPPRIDYAFHTHKQERIGGWTSEAPNPDRDGVWFYIDIHDASSKLEIHTQPVTAPLCLGDQRVTFLILEGKDTKPLYGSIWKTLEKQGAKRCGR
jgi:hypothetical protein